MQSELKLTSYRKLRNFICTEIAKLNGIYTNTERSDLLTRAECLSQIAFFKDSLAILTKNKEYLCDE